MSVETVKAFNGGIIKSLTAEKTAAELLWNEHPKFKGVALKHLVTGSDTKGQFSCHLVRIEAGCEIGDHIHEGKWELHEVIGGSGRCIIADKRVDYSPGVIGLIPPDIHHTVAAEQELYLFAKFIPALV